MKAIELDEREIRIEILPGIEGILSPWGKEPVLFVNKVRASVFMDGKNTEGLKVSATIDTDNIQVIYPELSGAEQTHFLKQFRQEVLETGTFRKIDFVSTGISVKEDVKEIWVAGGLRIHGVQRAIVIPFRPYKDKLMEGTVTIKQTDFGIVPLVGFGGALRAKDEVKIRLVVSVSDLVT